MYSMSNLKVAILGSGNIGTDLMKKIMRSPHLDLTTVIGIDPDSDGLRKARRSRIQYDTHRAGRLFRKS